MSVATTERTKSPAFCRMVMEEAPESNSVANQVLPATAISISVANSNTLPRKLFPEDTPATFVCRRCKKSFYNATALQNHKKMQHDADSSSSESDHITPFTSLRPSDQVFNDFCGFKFIPRKKSETDPTSTQDGITTRTFTEDTSYLIIRVDGDELDPKRSRLEGAVKRAQSKIGKPLVDLRGPFTCTFPSALCPDLQCRQIFFNCCDYSLHYREEHTKRRKAALRCQVCEKRLDRDFYPNNSIVPQLQPINRVTFTCRMCGQAFHTSSEYDEHNRVIHAKIKPHQCSICAKRFTQQGGLQQHMRMHTGIRPFACSFCPKAFTQKAGLDQHLRTHTKIKPFKCVICSKCFSQSVHLRQHMRTHTNIQPFECSVCGRRFKQSSHLNFHMRSHVGETNSLVVERYAQEVPHQNQLEFLNLANLQPVQDGETLYYAAELAEPLGINPFNYQHDVLSDNVLSL